MSKYDSDTIIQQNQKEVDQQNKIKTQMKVPKVKPKNLTLSKNNISRFGRTEEEENEPEETKIAENNEDEEEDIIYPKKVEKPKVENLD